MLGSRPKLAESVERFTEITNNMAKTYAAKNHDYGNSFDKSLDKFGIVASIVRMGDKMNRIESLTNKEAKVNDESIKDTLLDLANYAIMTVMWLDKTRKGTEQCPSFSFTQKGKFMKVELENILDIGTTLYSLDENFKIKRKVVVNIRSVFEQNVSHSPEIHTTYKVSNTMSNCYATDVRDSEIGKSWFTSKSDLLKKIAEQL